MPIDVSVQLTIYVLHFSTDGADGIHDRCVVLRVFAAELQQNRSNDSANSGDQRCDNDAPIHIKPLRP
jgi:hypothetical protein